MAKSDLTNLSMTELQIEIRRRERQLRSLHRKRSRLVAQLREVEEQISAAGGEISAIEGAGGRRRPRNDMNLADALAALLSNKVLSVTEAAEEVQAEGYRTTSPNFRTIVNQTLLKDKRFKRVGRGRYTSQAGAKSTPASADRKKKKRTARRRPSKKR